MPSSARIRCSIHRTVVALAATAALLGIANGTAVGQVRGTTAAVQARPALTSVTPACGSCGGGF